MKNEIAWYIWLIAGLANATFFPLWAPLSRKLRLLSADRILGYSLLLLFDMILLSYAFVLEVSVVGGVLNIGRTINDNQGVLGLLGVLVAAYAIYITIRSQQFEAAHKRIDEENEVEKAVTTTVDEIIHNLQHFARQIAKDSSYLAFPATNFSNLFSLQNERWKRFIPIRIQYRINTLKMILNSNRAILHAASDLDSSIALFSRLDYSGITSISEACVIFKVERDETGKVKDPKWQQPHFDERVTTHLVRILLELAIEYPNVRNYLKSENLFSWIDDFFGGIKKHSGYWYYSKSSEVPESDQRRLRVDKEPLYCWDADKPIEGVNMVSLRTTILDLEH